ncbi:MAG: hypothetical protein K9N23_05830 [Akkermansiaceae bacterium]|nr:hypothetical protein [Akkermansiaceae bacterium]
MKTNSDPPVRPGLEPVLRQLRRRIRRVQAGRGALITLVTALAALLVLVVIDYRCSPLPQVARWALTISWIAAVLAAAYIACWRPLLRPLELVRIARWLEIRHPELDERVSTVLELTGAEARGMSPGLMEELARVAVTDLAAINPRVEVSGRRMRRWLAPALVLLAGWSILLVLAPAWTTRHVVRALVPGSALGNSAGTFIVEPGTIELIEGDPLRITVRYHGTRSGTLEAVLHLADGSSLTEPLREESGAFIYQLEKATTGFDYEIRAGRETSDRFQVTVWPRPRLKDARVTLDFPAYTGIPRREQGLGDGIAAVAGTRAELRARINTPVQSARFEINGSAAGTIQHEHSAAGGSITVRWPMATPGQGEARLLLVHRLGREFEALRFSVETLADAPPDVKWTSPTATELRVRPDETLGLAYQATDDLGLGAVFMDVEPNNGKPAALPQDMPTSVGRAIPPVWRGGVRQPVGALLQQWPDAGSFKLRMRVADSRPTDLGGPGTAVSDWITIHLDKGAEPLARHEVFAAHSDARETLEKARQKVEQARGKIESNRDKLAKNEVNEPSRAELAKAREQLADAREQLEQLADRMEESPHAAQAEAVREAAAAAEQARQQLEETPLQDTAKDREQMAEQAKQSATRTEQQLREVLDKIQQAEPQLHDYARLLDLEQRQRELARQAEQALAQTAAKPTDPPPSPTSEPPPEWRQQQAQTAAELRDVADKHPQARAEALAEQAAQARDQAAEARAQAANQQALKPPAPPPNQPNPPGNAGLREQLAQEQAAIRDEVNEQLAEARQTRDEATANALPEAAQATEAAAEALQQPDSTDASEKVEQAAKELAQAAQDAHNRTESQQPPAGQPPAGQPPAGQPPADQPPAGQPPAGQPPADQPPAGQPPAGQPPAGQPPNPSSNQEPQVAEAARTAENLADLAERQQQVAQAMKALEAGNETAAREALAEMRAEQVAELAGEIQELPQVGGSSGPMQQAAQAANQAAHQAQEAARHEGQPEASAQHGEAAGKLEQAATNLDQAAAEFARQAGEAAAQPAAAGQAPMPGKPLAEAFQQATQAAAANSPATAASHANAAADALASAASDTKRAMQQGSGPPQPGGQPAQAQGGPPPPGSPPGIQPGTNPDENSRIRQPDPGVPPELAKLGISAGDWEKIKSSLMAETGGSSAVPLPEEYRDLVQKYFDQMTKGGAK